MARQPSYWMPTRSARIEVWGNDYRQILDTAVAAEELAFSAFYYGESPHSLNLETWTVLAGVTARTTSIRIGPVIANLASRLGVVPAFGATGARLDKALTGPARWWPRRWATTSTPAWTNSLPPASTLTTQWRSTPPAWALSAE